MTCNTPNLDLGNINAHAKFDQNPSMGSQDIDGNEISMLIKGRNSVDN